LKALAIAHFCLDLQWFLGIRELQLQVNDFSDANIAGNGRAQPAFGNVFGPANQGFFCRYDNAYIQKVSGMRSWKGPWVLFVLGHSS